MNLRIEIRRNSDGHVAEYVERNYEFIEYQWTDGNYGCDCNRGLFFNRAMGNDNGGAECGLTAYSVKISNDDTGRVIYDEF